MPAPRKKIVNKNAAVKKPQTIINPKPTKLKQRVKPEKIYTYSVSCSFTIQYSFTESEVEPDIEGIKGDFNPTDDALRSLEEKLAEAIGCNYPVKNFVAEAESRDLLGIL